MAKLRALWHEITDSLWFLPALLTLAAAGLALLLVRLDARMDFGRREELWWLFGGGAEGARGVLGAIAGSIMTVTGVVFSVTIVALQLASSQYTPRLLRQFMADRANQLVLGIFIGTFTYTLLVQRTVRGAGEEIPLFVPAVAVTGAVVLALVSIGFLIFFIHHVARSIQASVILERIARETRQGLASTFPAEAAGDEPFPVPAPPPRYIFAQRSGYLQAVAEDTLLRAAVRHGVLLRLERMPGEFLLAGQFLAAVWGRDERDAELSADVLGALHVGITRTPHQDPGLGIVELVDVAVKALSPGVNDPTTAINVLDRLGELLLEFARCPQHERVLRDERGQPRVLLPRPQLAAVLELAVDQLRHYGAGSPSVAARLVGMLGNVAALAPAGAAALIRPHVLRTLEAAVQCIGVEHDREHVRRAAARALQVIDEREREGERERVRPRVR